ncbi:manganese transporter [Paenibacillus yonginensis]|uniref:Manganese transporter n=2 Tax=Paenibacillus yonginensis TaxID=1462996 RepID=A0A1B1MZH3_9BACL|nr:metal ABC transporter ATP-binding protein [Paenibacillus yonginensis]ANS74571.1 manganese transporter [Paenibacillus yonginensis]
MSIPAVSVTDLFVSYHGKPALDNISFTINPGTRVGIIGPNGAGKSTLLKSILGLIPKDHGEVRLLGQPVKEVRTRVAYVAQRSEIDFTFPITVLDTVLLGTYPGLSWLRRARRSHKEWAFECLTKVGMADFARRQIGELSGGQQQRVFLARALAQKAEIFCLDEPFVGIDASSEEAIIELLQEQQQSGKTILIVHHDLSKTEEYFDELVLLNAGLIAAGPVQEVFQPEMMMKAYAAQLSFFKRKE